MKSVLGATLTIMLLSTFLFGVVPFTKANYSPAPPIIFIQSPRNNYVYYNDSLQLKILIKTAFDINGSRQAFYSLDGQANVSIPIEFSFEKNSYHFSDATGSVNLTGLPTGIHSIIVFALYYSGVDKKSAIFYVFDKDFLIMTISAIVVIPLATAVFLFRKKIFKSKLTNKQSFLTLSPI